MNHSTLQLFNRSTLAALAVAAFAATSAHAESTSYWFRVTAPEAVGARLEATLIPSRMREIGLEKSKIGDDGRSGWVRMPRILANGGKCELYAGLVLRLMEGTNYVGKASVGFELAAAPDAEPLQTLPALDVGGRRRHRRRRRERPGGEAADVLVPETPRRA